MDNDALSALLSDPEALQNAMKTVSGLFGGAPETEPPSSPAPADDPTGDMMARALPVISSVLQSGQAAVNPEKRALLRALRPFVTDEVAGQFDRAIRLVSMAGMARSVFGQLGQSGAPDDGAKPL